MTGLPLALTMGDPAGIGPELTLKAWQSGRGGAPFVALDDPESLASVARTLGLDVPIRAVTTAADAAACFAEALPVLAVKLAKPAVAGQPDTANAAAVIASIERAVRLAEAGEAGAVVTNPISKAILYGAGFAYPGHTEFLAALTGAKLPVMMLAGPSLRVVPVTIHIGLRRVFEVLTSELIVATSRITAAALRRDFGIARPRLAMAGLNPHAGEAGAMGSEEQTIVEPAMAALRAEGIEVSGPWPPDTMFTADARGKYDVAICMYHDQALIPLKTIDMAQGVNVTLGLPIIRTSPDHGTAFAIAGKGIADSSSLIAALTLAASLVAARKGAA